MLKTSTDQDENCYWVDIKDSRKTKFCNIPMSVQLILPSNGFDRNVEALVMVRFEHSYRFLPYPVERKGWFCDNNLAQSVKYFHEKTSPKITKLMGYKKDKIWVRSACQNSVCFRTDHGGYEWIPQPWNEPFHKDCPEPTIISQAP
jgi:hypothetical protein